LEIQELLETLEDKKLKKKVLNLWASVEANFREMPASVKYHHRYQGGLYIHTKEVIELALKLYETLKDSFDPERVKRDDVLLMAFAHDLDKIDKYVRNKKKFYSNSTDFVWNEARVDTNDTADVVNLLGQYDINLNNIQLNSLSFSHGGWSVDRGKMTALATIIHCADILSLALEEKKPNVI
jgi:23S rRNA maturation-related 3'-5' exoribonuclease YhaM